MSYYNEFPENESDNYDEMERQIQEEKYFDECWEIHSAMMEYIEDQLLQDGFLELDTTLNKR